MRQPLPLRAYRLYAEAADMGNALRLCYRRYLLMFYMRFPPPWRYFITAGSAALQYAVISFTAFVVITMLILRASYGCAQQEAVRSRRALQHTGFSAQRTNAFPLSVTRFASFIQYARHIYHARPTTHMLQ